MENRAKQIDEMLNNECSVEIANAFIRGAQWADNNPSEDTIMQIVEAYKLWVQEFYTMPLTEFVVKWLKRNEQ